MFSFSLFGNSTRPSRPATPALIAESLDLRATPTNLAPQIVDFGGYEIMPSLFYFSGRVIDENPGGLTVTLGGNTNTIQGFTLETDADGYFSTMIYLQSDGSDTGTVTASTIDDEGLASNVPSLDIAPYVG